MDTMTFKNKKEEEDFKKATRRSNRDFTKATDVHFFKSEHIVPILRGMTPEQLEIFEHLTGINRQTIH